MNANTTKGKTGFMDREINPTAGAALAALVAATLWFGLGIGDFLKRDRELQVQIDANVAAATIAAYGFKDAVPVAAQAYDHCPTSTFREAGAFDVRHAGGAWTHVFVCETTAGAAMLMVSQHPAANHD